MNTAIWGPPLWRVLHTLSYSVNNISNLHADKVVNFINTLKYVLPCVYCRTSFRRFIDEVNEKYKESLYNIIKHNNFYSWMYDIHTLVNEKLDWQRAIEVLKPSGLSDEIMNSIRKDGVFKSRQITLECLTKRFMVRPVSFCTDDIWDILIIFALNFPLSRDDEYNIKVEEYRNFFILFPEILMIIFSGAAGKLVQVLIEGLNDVFFQPALTSPDECLRWVIVQNIAYKNNLSVLSVYETKTNMVDSHKTQTLEIFNVVRAHRCSHGSCV